MKNASGRILKNLFAILDGLEGHCIDYTRPEIVVAKSAVSTREYKMTSSSIFNRGAETRPVIDDGLAR
jgi:hypothetical protein